MVRSNEWVVFVMATTSIILGALSSPRPSKPPAGYRYRSIWFLGSVFPHDRDFGAPYQLGLALGVLVPLHVVV